MTISESDPLYSVKLKIERAKHHLSNLDSELRAYRSRQPYTVIREDNSKTGDHIFRFKANETIPVEIPLIIGDVVHNLRSAFDHLVCQCVIANRRQVRTRTRFPIGTSQQRFTGNFKGAVKGASEKAQKLIWRLKPYEGGCESFWILSELDIMDKHNKIVPVWTVFNQTNVLPNIPAEWLQAGPIQVPGLSLITKRSGQPVEDGSEFFSMSGSIEDVEKHCQFQFAFDITLGESGIATGKPILPCLGELIQFTERVIDIFSRCIFK